MATASVSTPLKSHRGLFSSRTAGGRMPLTPSPRQASTTTVPVNRNSSPFTPEGRSSNDCRASSKSTYGGNLMAHLSRSASKPSHRESPKSNIARGVQTPRKALELGVSDFTLTGTGKTPASSKSKKAPLRQKSTKTTISYGGDRFIPNRGASSAISNAGSSKLSSNDRQRPRSSNAESSSVLSSAADDAAAALESLNINDDDDEADNYSRPSPNTVAYQDSLANACGVKLNTRILEFKPAAPESSKPIDLRQQYNRPLKSASTSSAQLRRRIATAPERVLDAPGLIDDYYLNLLDWSSGNQVAIGLERSVYVWSADEGSVSCLLESPADTYISSVKWSDDGAYVGVGMGTGEVQI
ncbi:WD repeat-containing protein slp1 [Tolypocladium ophioglossoides CBS 100239]|uniref:WD repeat-containing protein slp1 n=1 Tax=Tolypocladium ophioglossoides (strain CBS 100239) TaxID=1163406 RepID=A0A0L0NBG9_TOLOC|nr:WD repeat-containing protein slp1 [Tolypocladium ophioglossoides CBS 100239]